MAGCTETGGTSFLVSEDGKSLHKGNVTPRFVLSRCDFLGGSTRQVIGIPRRGSAFQKDEKDQDTVSHPGLFLIVLYYRFLCHLFETGSGYILTFNYIQVINITVTQPGRGSGMGTVSTEISTFV